MAATPQNGVITVVSQNGKKSQNVSFYCSDVTATSCTFSKTGAAVAGSTAYVTFAENMYVVRASINAGMVDTTAIVIERDQAQSGDVITYAAMLDTLATPALVRIPLKAGSQLGFRQG